MNIYHDAKGAVMEHMDVELFLNHTDPDWFDHYKCEASIAFEQMTEYMTPQEIEDVIKESGCMNGHTPIHLRNQAE